MVKSYPPWKEKRRIHNTTNAAVLHFQLKNLVHATFTYTTASTWLSLRERGMEREGERGREREREGRREMEREREAVGEDLVRAIGEDSREGVCQANGVAPVETSDTPRH